ncbi:TolC family protein [Tenuifilum osseticum]|uniref:TolC family protein n=1 Tax=Tenuifilum osseticum TaxID=3374723 RepID=UPI0034E3C49D
MITRSKITLVLVTVAFAGVTRAQISFDRVLQQVDSNNLMLKALRQKLEAERIAARIGISPSNPQAEVIYQWGSPVDLGNKTTISITQQFDFPTAYIYRAKLAKGMASALENEFRSKRSEVLQKAGLLYADLVYHNALLVELNRQLKNAMVIAQSLKQKFEAGEIGVIPYTQAELVYHELNSRIIQIRLEQKSIADELVTLNGSVPIAITDSVMLVPELPDSFESWLGVAESQNPELAYLKSETENSRLKLKLSKAEVLPTFNAGYASEKVGGERFQGIVAGISIPLWEKSNTVRYARAMNRYMQLNTDDYLYSFRQSSQRLFSKVKALQELTNHLSQYISTFDIADKLYLALQKGEISIVDYYTELNSYNSIKERLLEVQHECLKAYIELNRFSY